MPQSGFLARAELADGKSSRKEFSKALVLMVKAVDPTNLYGSHAI